MNVKCVDTGFLTLSQYILLDPFLLLFISATVLCYVEFSAVAKRSVVVSLWSVCVVTSDPFTCLWFMNDDELVKTVFVCSCGKRTVYYVCIYCNVSADLKIIIFNHVNS